MNSNARAPRNKWPLIVTLMSTATIHNDSPPPPSSSSSTTPSHMAVYSIEPPFRRVQCTEHRWVDTLLRRILLHCAHQRHNADSPNDIVRVITHVGHTAPTGGVAWTKGDTVPSLQEMYGRCVCVGGGGRGVRGSQSQHNVFEEVKFSNPFKC